MDINSLIEKAQQIEEATEANISGALFQVVDNLTFDECEEILTERAAGDERKMQSYQKKLARAKSDGGYFNIHSIRLLVERILEATMNGR